MQDQSKYSRYQRAAEVELTRVTLALVSLVMIGIMARLGIWQLDRSEFKAQRQAMLQDRSRQPPVTLGNALLDPREWQYYRVTVSGRYLADKGVLIDNVVNQGRPGVSVVTPLRIGESDTLVLVDRGWRPWGEDRVFLPAVDTPGATVTLEGLLVPAAEKHFYLGNPDESGERRQLWPQLDLERFAASVENPVQPLILVLDEGQPGSYERVWKSSGDEWVLRHKAYALQWFALSFTLFLITAILLYRSAGRRRT